MFTSSTNRMNFFPAVGPNTPFLRFSHLPSIRSCGGKIVKKWSREDITSIDNNANDIITRHRNQQPENTSPAQPPALILPAPHTTTRTTPLNTTPPPPSPPITTDKCLRIFKGILHTHRGRFVPSAHKQNMPAFDWPTSARRRRGRGEQRSPTLPSAGAEPRSPSYRCPSALHVTAHVRSGKTRTAVYYICLEPSTSDCSGGNTVRMDRSGCLTM